jgi:hypothetical protein
MFLVLAVHSTARVVKENMFALRFTPFPFLPLLRAACDPPSVVYLPLSRPASTYIPILIIERCDTQPFANCVSTVSPFSDNQYVRVGSVTAPFLYIKDSRQ